MTLQQLAKQLNIPADKLEKESLRVFLLTKLGEIEAKRHRIGKKYGVESALDWDEKLQEGKLHEGEYEEMEDYFRLDWLDFQKEQIIKDLLTFA